MPGPHSEIVLAGEGSGLQWHYVGAGLIVLLTVVGPRLHQLATLVQDVAALVGLLERIPLDMREAKLDDLSRIVRTLSRPSLEGCEIVVCKLPDNHCSRGAMIKWQK